jgi:hypothetical protein
MSNKLSNATSQAPSKIRISKTKASRRREITKIRAEINEIQTKNKNKKNPNQ